MTDSERLGLVAGRLERATERLRRQDEAEARLAMLEARVLRIHVGGVLVALLLLLLAVALR